MEPTDEQAGEGLEGEENIPRRQQQWVAQGGERADPAGMRRDKGWGVPAVCCQLVVCCL